MGNARMNKFADAAGLLVCPRCGEAVGMDGTSLRCARGHAFAVAAKGYANFVPNQRPLKGYDRAFFEARARFFADGYYRHVLDAVLDELRGLPAVPRTVLDAGCGEGYYARAVDAALNGRGCSAGGGGSSDCPQAGAPPARAVGPTRVFALDIAKEAVQVASRGGGAVLWLVGDIARIPVRTAAVDCLLDVFTPANYAEFRRVLAPGGTIVKVVPGANHLVELRRAARDVIRGAGYSNDRVADCFFEHCTLERRRTASATLPLNDGQFRDLCAMTPLFFGVDAAAAEACRVSSVTVEADLLVGRFD